MDISNSRLRWRWCHLKRPRQSRRMPFPFLIIVSSFCLIGASCVHCLSLFCCVVPDAEALEAVFSFEENPKGLPAGVVYQAQSPLLPVEGLTVCRGRDMFGVFPLLFSCPWVLLNLPRDLAFRWSWARVAKVVVCSEAAVWNQASSLNIGALRWQKITMRLINNDHSF